MVRPAALVLLLLLVGASSALAEPAVDVALAGIRSARSIERERAASALGLASTPLDRARAACALAGVLGDPLPTVRRSAAASLGRLGDRRYAPHLRARLDREREPTALAAVLLAVGALRDREAAPRMATLARTHPVPSVRAAALTALGDLGVGLARTTALRTLSTPGVPDPDWSLRAAAMLALARVGRAEDVGPILVAWREGGGAERWFARAALARVVAALDPDPLPELNRLVQDRDARVALTAAEGIARRAPVEHLFALLRHDGQTVRAAAASASARVRAEATYPRLRSLARFDPARRVRWAAALALFHVEDPLGDDLVLVGLQTDEPVIWAEALAALAARLNANHGRDVDAWRTALRRWRAAR